MRIVFITNNYTPYKGGVVSSINAIVQELQEQGHELTVITLDFLGQAHEDPSWVKRLHCPLRFSYRTNYMAMPWRATKQIIALLRALKPDMVHVHHPFLLGVAGYKAARTLHIPVVFTYHTLYEDYAHYVPLPQSFVRWYIRRSVSRFCARVGGIVAPSLMIKTRLQQQGVSVPLCVVPSPLQPVFMQNAYPEREERTAIALLVVSRMVKEKNIKAVLRVAAALQEKKIPFTLTLIGYGPEYHALQRYAYHTCKLPKEQVQFVHSPLKAAIAAAYQQADLFLFCSKSGDTQGLVLAEAMAGGAPVLAFDGPGQRDIIKQGNNGYIVADEHEMIEKIKILQRDHAELKRLSQQAFATAQSYHPSMLVKRLLAFYTDGITVR